MANYTKVFTKPYADGYEDLPSQTTPITAETLNDKDDTLEHIEDYLYDNPIAEVVDNLTTNDATKALSAKQGKILNDTKLNVADLPNSDIQTSTTGQFSTVTGGLMQSCVVDLDPIQDLHGYSKPWVGGSGKNKLPLTVENVKSASTSGTWSGNKYTINGVVYELFANEDDAITSIKATGTATADAPLVLYRNLSLPNGNYMWSASPSGGSGSTYRAYLTGVTASDTGNGTTFSISGQTIGVACIISNGYAIPSSGLTFYPQIESGSTKTSFEPYSNICPISGHTQVQVGNVGKNWLRLTLDALKSYNTDGTWNGNVYVFNGVTATILTDSLENVIGILINGTASSNYTLYLNSVATSNAPSPFILNGCVSGGSNGTYCLIIQLSSSPWTWITSDVGGGATGTLDEDKGYQCIFRMYAGVSLNNKIIKPMIRKATDTDPTYEPYKGYTVTINLGGTYYGGTLDAVSGKLTVTHKFVSLKDYTFAKAGNNFYNSQITDFKTNGSDSVRFGNGVCDSFGFLGSSSWETVDNAITMFYNTSYSGYRVFIHSTSLQNMTENEFNAWMTTNDVKLCYELATPTTIQLDPQTLETLVGQNNVTVPLTGQSIEEVEFREVMTWDDVNKAVEFTDANNLINAVKVGKTVTVNIACDSFAMVGRMSEDAWDYITSEALPEEMRPQKTIHANILNILTLGGGYSITSIPCRINTTGIIEAFLLHQQTAQPYGTITYDIK